MELKEYELMAEVEDTHWWHCARREIVAAAIEQYLPQSQQPPLRLVEVGCGTGGNLEMFSRFGTVLGAEPEPFALEALRTKFGSRYSVLKHSIPEPLPGPFDVVGMLDVLEHVEDDSGALRWVADQLTPAGIAVVTVPAFPFLWCEHDTAAHHFRRYTEASLLEIVPHEFEVLHVSYFNLLFFGVVATVRTAMRLVPRAWRPQGTQMALPPRAINRVCYQLFRQERRLVAQHRLPFGVSVLLVLRRKGASAQTSSS